jgi:hypothetical protein
MKYTLLIALLLLLNAAHLGEKQQIQILKVFGLTLQHLETAQ